MAGISDDDVVEDFDFEKLAGSDEITGNFDILVLTRIDGHLGGGAQN